MRDTTLISAFRRPFCLAIVFVVSAFGATACPDREEAIDAVGGAPGRQVDIARERAKAAEEKILERAEEANAVHAVPDTE